MRAKQNFSRRSMITIICSLSCFLITFSVWAGESVIIGYTNHAEATAYSNGRRMVRTSDDRRVVVYQDSLADKPVGSLPRYRLRSMRKKLDASAGKTADRQTPARVAGKGLGERGVFVSLGGG